MSITVDIDTSTVAIAERRWPAVALVCPNAEGDTTSDFERTLGDTVPSLFGGWEVYVPLENGLLCEVCSLERGYGMTLNVTTCYLMKQYDDEPDIYLPMGVKLLGSGLVLSDGRGQWWPQAEPEWISETIERMSSKRVPRLPDGPQARMINLNESVRLHGLLAETWKKP